MTALLYGFGRHVWELSPEQVSSYQKASHSTTRPLRSQFLLTLGKVFFTGQISWICASTTVKLAVLLFYWRIFPSMTFRRVVCAMAAFIVCYFLACLVTFIMQCYPVYSFWQPAATVHCINRNEFYLAAAVLGLLTDVVLVTMPMPVLWHLKITTKKKVQLSIVFFVGGW